MLFSSQNRTNLPFPSSKGKVKEEEEEEIEKRGKVSMSIRKYKTQE